MKVIKKQSKQTYLSKKDNKEHHFHNYFLVFENGSRIEIKCAFPEDYKKLEAVCYYEK